MSLLRGQRYNRTKRAQGGTGSNQYKKQTPQNEGTAESLAGQYGVSRATIERDGQFAQAVDTLEEVALWRLKISIRFLLLASYT